MNREHLRAFVWLRWRLRANQFRKAGALSTALAGLFLGMCLVAAVTLFAVGVAVGIYAFPGVKSHVHLFVWDGIVVVFLFSWMIGLLSELQRSEAIALERFLHLPVSPSGVFLINYLSSLASLSLIVFVPGAVGLILGMAVSCGPLMLLELPLLAAALFAVTAVTYQFQGWLAGLMANPRRRRTIIVLVTVGFIAIAQAPNLINLVRPWDTGTGPSTRRTERVNEATKALQEQAITLEENARRMKEIDQQYEAEKKDASQQSLDSSLRLGHLLNTVLPPGWLPLGAEGLAEGSVLPALLGTLGLCLIGSFSLRRAYRTTLRLYTGDFTSGDQKTPTTKTPAVSFDPTRIRLLERELPWVGEHVSAVATAAFRSLTRAPEAKMALLGPLIMVIVFGGIIASHEASPPAALRPLLAYGAGGMLLFITGLQLLANQFGYDRTGFRAYVLSPMSRRDILVGKNLAVAPLLLGLGLFGFVILGAAFPMRIDHYPMVLAQILATYLVVCLLANGLAILAPMPLAPGSLQPASPKIGAVLAQMLVMMLLPVFVLPVMAPYGVEVLLDQLDVVKGVPIGLLLSFVVLALAAMVYRWALRRQGEWLTAREQKILQVVTSKVE